MIKCDFCFREYKPLWEDSTTQGVNCASSFVRRKSGGYGIISHYGSDFDTNLYAVSSDSTLSLAEEASEATICDTCIRRGEKHGLFILEGEYSPGDPIMISAFTNE